jgi:hypothetical protein
VDLFAVVGFLVVDFVDIFVVVELVHFDMIDWIDWIDWVDLVVVDLVFVVVEVETEFDMIVVHFYFDMIDWVDFAELVVVDSVVYFEIGIVAMDFGLVGLCLQVGCSMR